MKNAVKRHELLVLGALRRHVELTGAQLHEITGIWISWLYPVLSKMEQDGEDHRGMGGGALSSAAPLSPAAIKRMTARSAQKAPSAR
jgi:hypothetical protein